MVLVGAIVSLTPGDGHRFGLVVRRGVQRAALACCIILRLRRFLGPGSTFNRRHQAVQPHPEKIFTIHGDENKTIDLASSLYKRYHIETHSPMNLETYRMI